MKGTGIPVDLNVMVKGPYSREVKDSAGAVKGLEVGLTAYLPEGGTDCVVVFGEGMERTGVPSAGTIMRVKGFVVFWQSWDQQFKILAQAFEPPQERAAK